VNYTSFLSLESRLHVLSALQSSNEDGLPHYGLAFSAQDSEAFEFSP
jgi:hypothetical protein